MGTFTRILGSTLIPLRMAAMSREKNHRITLSRIERAMISLKKRESPHSIDMFQVNSFTKQFQQIAQIAPLQILECKLLSQGRGFTCTSCQFTATTKFVALLHSEHEHCHYKPLWKPRLQNMSREDLITLSVDITTYILWKWFPKSQCFVCRHTATHNPCVHSSPQTMHQRHPGFRAKTVEVAFHLLSSLPVFLDAISGDCNTPLLLAFFAKVFADLARTTSEIPISLSRNTPLEIFVSRQIIKSESNPENIFDIAKLMISSKYDRSWTNNWQETASDLRYTFRDPTKVAAVASVRRHYRGSYARDDPGILLLILYATVISGLIWGGALRVEGAKISMQRFLEGAFFCPVLVTLLSLGGMTVLLYIFLKQVTSLQVLVHIRRMLPRNIPFSGRYTDPIADEVSDPIESHLEMEHCFDLVCNGAIPAIAILSFAQFIVLPLIISQSVPRLSAFVANLHHAAAATVFVYEVAVGITILPHPLCRGASLLFLPLAFWLLLLLILSCCKINLTTMILNALYGPFFSPNQ